MTKTVRVSKIELCHKTPLYLKLLDEYPDFIELEAEVVEPWYCEEIGRPERLGGSYTIHRGQCNECKATPKRIERLNFNKDIALNEMQMFNAVNELIEAVNRINKV